jgi:UDP-N-acetyl-D-mannosaminuronic acid transferase (WecB/TagA/CpsF family)
MRYAIICETSAGRKSVEYVGSTKAYTLKKLETLRQRHPGLTFEYIEFADADEEEQYREYIRQYNRTLE